MADIKLNQGLDPTFTRATTANKRDGSSVASGAARYENVIDAFVIDKEYEWDRGSYTRCDASGNILAIENMRPTFSRASSGWIDGVAVAGSTPRFHGDVLEYGATNLFTYSEPTGAPQMSAQSNVTYAADFGGVNGFTNCVTFGDNSLSRYAYAGNAGVTAGKKYTISCYVKMDDGSAPTISNAAGYDFALVIGNTQLSHSTSPATITLVSGTVYRVSATVSAASSTSLNNGVLKAGTHSAKGFKVTGFQIEENPSVTSYIATAGSVVNRATTYNKIGYLSEQGVTNLVTYSYDFSDASWTKGNLSVSANAVYAPDGTLSADKLVENSSNGFHYVQKSDVFTASQPGTISVYARAAERGNLYFSFNNIYANFNLINGTVTGTTGSPDATSIQYVGNGWYRCSISETSIVATDDNIQIGPASGTVNSYLGDGTSGIYIWGAQAEAKLAPTTYIPTTSATVTRNSDMLSIPAKDVIGPSGTIIINFYNDGDDTNTRNRIFLTASTGGSSTSGVLTLYQVLGAANRWRSYFGKADGTLQAISEGDSAISSGFHTLALRWTTSNQQLWVDGAFLVSGALTETPSFGSSHTIYFGPNVTNSTGFPEVPISEVNFFNTTLSDADMALYGAASGYAIPIRAETTYQIKFNNNLNFATSGIYVSEWLNAGVSGAIFTSTTVNSTTPSGTSIVTEYRTSDSDTQATASAWSTTLVTGKYVQFRHYLVNDGTTAYVPSVTSHTITPNDYGKCVTIEESTTNLLTSPTSPATQDVTVTAAGDYNLSIYGTDASSGTCVIEHKKVETTTSDFGTGTLSNVQGSSNALALATAKAAPTFTRATSSTNYDGSTVTSGNARYHLGKNLFTKNQSDVETDTSGFVAVNSTIHSRSTSEAWQGSASLQLTYSHGSGTYIGVAVGLDGETVWASPNGYVLEPNTTYTYSFYMKTTASVPFSIRHFVWCPTPSTVLSSIGLNTPTSSWTRYSGSFTTGSSVGQYDSYAIRIDQNASAATGNVFIDGLQFEVGSSATDWVQGGPHAVMIEEATTNLYIDGIQRFEVSGGTKWQGYGTSTASTGTVTSGQVDPYGGSNAYRVQTVSGDLALKWYAGFGTGTSGLVYSGQIWVKNNDASNSIDVKSNQGSQTVSVSNSDGWKLVKFENITSNGSGIFQHQFHTASAGTNLDVTLMNPQYEQKAYATTYIAPGTTRNAEVLGIPSGIVSNTQGTVITRAYWDGDHDAAVANGTYNLVYFDTNSGSNNLIRLVRFSNFLDARLYDGTGALVANATWSNPHSTLSVGWHIFGIRWSSSRLSLYVDGVERAFVASPTLPAASPTRLYVGSGGSIQNWNQPIDTYSVFGEALTDAEMVAMTTPSGSISLDRRSRYDLRFVNNLNHGEGGYRLTTGVALDNIGTIGGSTIDWTVSAATGSSGIIETSIDNGSTYSTATDGSSITGLTDGVSATGKTFICRQTLLTEDANSVQPTLTDIEYRITQKWENIPSTFIKPVYTTLRFTPTNLTKFQLENKRFATSFVDGTRNDDALSISASGIINFASGAVVVRFYDDQGYVGPSTNTRTRVLFSVSKDSSSSGTLYLYQSTNGGTPINTYIGSDSATLQTAVKNRVLSKGWHTMAVRWGNSNISLWCDGAFEASGNLSSIPTMTTGHIIKIGSDYNSGSQTGGYDISQVDIFGEALTDAEMIAYTAASGASISMTPKHTYQMKFEDNLEYGMTGIFYSRWHDAGSNTAGTPWVTYTKVENKPAGTDVKYFFGANDNQAAITTWTEDITAVTGRYLKTKICLMSDDTNAATPTVTSVRVFPQYS